MTTQTTRLYLLQELEAADNASELAESEVTALRDVADWIESS